VRSDEAARDSTAVVTRELGGHALGERSLVRAANFRKALALTREAMRPGEVVLRLRLAPDELMTTVRDPNGNTRLIYVGVDFGVRQRDWSVDTGSKPLSLEGVLATVPEKVVRASLRAAGADDTHLDYLALSGGEPPSWLISLDDVPMDDRTWTADLAGVAVTHPGQMPEAHGLNGRSLLRAPNLAKALEQVSERGTRAIVVRVEPERLDVQLRDGRWAQVDAAQRLTIRAASATAEQARGVPLDRIDPAAPGRAFATAAQRGHLSLDRVDYAVLVFGNQWDLYFAKVPSTKAHWRANASGRAVERVG
jgi:hypothetical protein